jgi:hypothetical protein
MAGEFFFFLTEQRDLKQDDTASTACMKDPAPTASLSRTLASNDPYALA